MFLLLRESPSASVFAGQAFAPVVELGRLFLHLARVALQLLGSAVHLQGAFLQLLLPLLQHALRAVEPEQVGLVLLLPLFECRLLVRKLAIARLDVGEAHGHLALHVLLARRHDTMLFFEDTALAVELFAARLQFRLLLGHLLAHGVEQDGLGLVLVLFPLNAESGAANGLAHLRQFLALLPEALMQLAFELIQFLPCIRREPLPPAALSAHHWW